MLLGFLRHGLQRGEFRRIELAVLVDIGLGELGLDLGRFLGLVERDLAVTVRVQVLERSRAAAGPSQARDCH